MDDSLFEILKSNMIERDLEFKVNPAASKISELTENQIIQLLDLIVDYFSNPKDSSTMREVISMTFLYTHDIIEATSSQKISGLIYKRAFENMVKIYKIKIKKRYNYLLEESNPICTPWNSNVYSWDYIDENKLIYFNSLKPDEIMELEKIIDDNFNAFVTEYEHITNEISINSHQKPIKGLSVAITMIFPFSDEFVSKHTLKIVPWMLLENERFIKSVKNPDIIKSILGDSMTYFMNEVLDRTTFGQLKNVFKTDQSVVDATALLLFIK